MFCTLLGCWGPRHTFTLMGFLGFASIYAMRVNLSLVIISMVNHTAIPHVIQTESVDICPQSASENHTFNANKVIQNEKKGKDVNVNQLTYPNTGRRICLGRISTRNHSRLFLLGLHRYTNTRRTFGGANRTEKITRLWNPQFISAHLVDTHCNSNKRYAAHLFSRRNGFGRGKLCEQLNADQLSILQNKRRIQSLLKLQGITLPAMHSMLAERAPPSARGWMAIYVFTVNYHGRTKWCVLLWVSSKSLKILILIVSSTKRCGKRN